MSAPNSSVSVFHFTSRISNAKIQKYKAATERGMNPGTTNGSKLTSTSNTTKLKRPASHESLDTSSIQPTKRPKLKLNVRPPGAPSDTVVVAQPKRESSLRIRYSENMIIDAADVENVDMEPPAKPSLPVSTDHASLKSGNTKENEPPTVPPPQSSAPATSHGYGRDFMSYYVTGAEDEPEDKEPPPAPPISTKPEPPKQVPVPTVPDVKRKQAQFEHHIGPHPDLSRPRPPPPRQPHAQPTVHLIDTSKKSAVPTEPDTVAVMVKKLESLSAALSNFGGIPEVAKPEEEDSMDENKDEGRNESTAVEQKTVTPEQNHVSDDVDNFLAMFEDDDEDDKPDPLDYKLEERGEPDGALGYGIQFIQNALRSWAQQRLTAQYTHHCYQQQLARDAAQPTKRGPGRPRKFENGDEDSRMPPLPLNIQYDLAKTPEGAAITAFQEVRDSGCLQVNVLLPAELSRALSRLYLQIDHLINQGAQNGPPWRCMSYGAQIAAQRVRVEKWKGDQARAQEEMARQHHVNQQRVMQQMGITHYHPSQLTQEQIQQQHAIDLERKRSLQHAAQQPHLKKYLTNPLKLDTMPMVPPTVSSTHRPPIESIPPNGVSQSPTQADGKNVQLDKIKLYMPNYLPRSGQSMKFSFAPQSELALQTFGAQAFPTNRTGPNLPNRGPMNMSANVISGHAHIPNGVVKSPAVPSNVSAPRPTSAGSKQSVSEVVDLTTSGHSSDPVDAPISHGNAGDASTSAAEDLVDIVMKRNQFGPEDRKLAHAYADAVGGRGMKEGTNMRPMQGEQSASHDLALSDATVDALRALRGGPAEIAETSGSGAQ